MLKRLNALKTMDFSLIEIIIMVICYGFSMYTAFVYWEPVLKSFLVLTITILPLMVIIWSSSDKYIKAYEDVLVLYSIVVALILLTSTFILELRHEVLFYFVTICIPVLNIIIMLCLTTNIHLNKDISMMKDMLYYSSECLSLIYFSMIFVGFSWSKSANLILLTGATYFIMRIVFPVYARYYINVRT